MIFDRYDVVVVDFPFSDREASKRRPAVILCDADFINRTGNALLGMITSARQSDWPGDCAIDELAAAGLSRPCKVRMRLLTLSGDRLGGPIGRLASDDATRVAGAVRTLLLP